MSENMENTLETILTILNKVVIIGIAVLIVWALQALTTHPEVLERYPFTRSVILRASLSLVGVAVSIDFFSAYTPSLSEIVLNLALAGIMFFIYRAYKTGELVRRNGNGNGIVK